MSEQTVRILLRIPTGLKTKLVALAEREHRSLNKQIEFLLDRSTQKEIVESDWPGTEIDSQERVSIRRKAKDRQPRAVNDTRR